MGPTASGKTDLAIEIAKKRGDIELISVDSALIYTDMNIGTAKPDAQTLQEFPHKLVDIITPEEEYSVARFLSDSKTYIDNAINSGKTPLLVGGTAFYFNALQNGISNLPASTVQSRKYFDDLLREKGSVHLHNLLVKTDKVASEKIHKHDSQRITRALEVEYLTGKTLTQLQGNKESSQYVFKKIVLMPPRNILHQRIEKRFLQMLENGFLEEVAGLKNKYNLNENLPSMRSVGYRQMWQYLEGIIDKKMMTEKAIIATRQLCKRQSTWFNKEKKHQNPALFIENNHINTIKNYV
jgi:tRNA dimethylallyltransferase